MIIHTAPLKSYSPLESQEWYVSQDRANKLDRFYQNAAETKHVANSRMGENVVIAEIDVANIGFFNAWLMPFTFYWTSCGILTNCVLLAKLPAPQFGTKYLPKWLIGNCCLRNILLWNSMEIKIVSCMEVYLNVDVYHEVAIFVRFQCL